MAKVLVVGGAGYIGGWLIDRAVEAGHEVRVYDLLLYEDRYLKEVDFVAGDVLDRERLRPHLDWADTVVWLAALVGDPACALDPALTRKINVDSVEWLCDDFDGRIVFPSTCSVYGAQDESSTRRARPPRCPCTPRPSSRPSGAHGAAAREPDLPARDARRASATPTRASDSTSSSTCSSLRAKLVGELQVFGGRAVPAAAARARRRHRDRPAPRDRTPRASTTSAPRTRRSSRSPSGSSSARRGDDPARRDAVPGHAQLPRLVRARGGASSASSRSSTTDDAIDQIAALIDAGRVKDLSLAVFSNLEALRPYLQPEAIPLGREIRTSHSLARHAGQPAARRHDERGAELIRGGVAADDRGRVYFANDFDLGPVPALLHGRELRVGPCGRGTRTGTSASGSWRSPGRRWPAASRSTTGSPRRPTPRSTASCSTPPTPRSSRSRRATRTARCPCSPGRRLLYLSDATLDESLDDDFRFPARGTGTPGTWPSGERRDLDHHPDPRRRRHARADGRAAEPARRRERRRRRGARRRCGQPRRHARARRRACRPLSAAAHALLVQDRAPAGFGTVLRLGMAYARAASACRDARRARPARADPEDARELRAGAHLVLCSRYEGRGRRRRTCPRRFARLPVALPARDPHRCSESTSPTAPTASAPSTAPSCRRSGSPAAASRSARRSRSRCMLAGGKDGARPGRADRADGARAVEVLARQRARRLRRDALRAPLHRAGLRWF